VQDHRLDDQVVWTPKFHSIWLARTEGVSVGEIVEVEVAVSRPGMPACAFDASQARSVARVTFSLVTSHKAIAAARLPRSKAVGKALTLIAAHAANHTVGSTPRAYERHPCAGRRGQRHDSRVDVAYEGAWWAK
jgi:hypothetical protein